MKILYKSGSFKNVDMISSFSFVELIILFIIDVLIFHLIYFIFPCFEGCKCLFMQKNF